MQYQKNVPKTFNEISMKIEQVGVARLPNPGEEPPKWSERPRGGDVRWSSAAVRILWPAGAAPRMHCTVEKSPQAEGSNWSPRDGRWERGLQKNGEKKVEKKLNLDWGRIKIDYEEKRDKRKKQRERKRNRKLLIHKGGRGGGGRGGGGGVGVGGMTRRWKGGESRQALYGPPHSLCSIN